MKFFLILFLVSFPVIASEKIYSLDYIYVNANSGQSSGGHSAIRLGELVYHFQFYPDKIFHIVREPWTEFKYVYGIQENRTILIRKINLTEKNFNFFFERMNEIYLIQKKELDNLVKLNDDVKILESLLRGDKTIHLKAAGYFSNRKAKKERYKNLLGKIEPIYGSNFLLKELNSLRKRIYEYKIQIKSQVIVNGSRNQYPRTVENFSTEYINLLSLLKVYEILFEELDLNSSSFFEFQANDKFESIENQLVIFLNLQEKEIISLLKSNSPNRGYSLLVLIARYLVIQKSIEEKKFFFLDSFGKNHALVVGDSIRNKPFLDEMNYLIGNKVSVAFNEFEKSKGLSGLGYTVLEDVVNRQREIISALNQSKVIRINFELMMPIKEESVSIDYDIVSNEALNQLLSRAILNKADYELNLQKKYSFNLFNRNCTTEIFYSLNHFLENAEKESLEKLGGVVRGEDFLVFIPVYAYYAVGKKYRVLKEEKIPSLRAIISEKYSKNDLYFSLMESTTLTSRFYKFNKEDTFFIFFTDDLIWQRPLFGTVNLLAGLGELGFGILNSPFDKGEHFIKGLQGIFFSGPEIIFFNIRKGTFAHVGRSDWAEENISVDKK